VLARPRKSFPHVCTHVALRIYAWSPIGKAGSLSPKRTPAGSSPSGLQISSRAASSPCGDDAVYGPKGRRPARCSHVSLAHLSLPKVPFQGQREPFGVVNAPSLLHFFGRGPPLRQHTGKAQPHSAHRHGKPLRDQPHTEGGLASKRCRSCTTSFINIIFRSRAAQQMTWFTKYRAGNTHRPDGGCRMMCNSYKYVFFMKVSACTEI